MLKQAEDFETTNYINTLGWIYVITMTSFSILDFLGVNHILENGVELAYYSFTIGGMALFVALYFHSSEEENGKEQYLKYLETIDPQLLVKATTSLEMSDWSKKLMVAYLNDKRAGWSLA